MLCFVNPFKISLKLSYTIWRELLRFETLVNVKWGNTLIDSVICHENERHCKVYPKQHILQQRSVVIEWSWNTQTTNPHSLLLSRPWSVIETVGYWCTDLRPMSCGRRRLDAEVFRRFQQRLLESRIVTIAAPVNAGRPQTVRTPDNGVAIIAAVEWRSWNI